jgi:hypothetical protein
MCRNVSPYDGVEDISTFDDDMFEDYCCNKIKSCQRFCGGKLINIEEYLDIVGLRTTNCE